MKVLVINAGSSSLKFTMFRMGREQMLAKGVVERIGLKEPKLIYKRNDGLSLEEPAEVLNHEDSMKLVCQILVDPEKGVLESLSEVQAIGHRVVHGAEKFSQSVKINDEVKRAIRMCASMAPLHNPPNLGGIEACEHAFPEVPNVAVFDTAFHQSMPAYSYLYAIPRELYEDYGIRKYGFHGTSHNFVAQAAAKFLDKPLDELKLITCHLGNGASITAINKGKVLDTSMGLTPLMGLVMGTRCGDIDPGVVIHLIKKGMTVDEVDNLLNKKSGLLGVSGTGSGDMRDLMQSIENGNENAKIAMDMFIHRLVHYIGAYFALLRGAHALVFTGGIGENNVEVRKLVISRLAALNCHLDEMENNVRGKLAEVSTPESKLKALVIPTDEELMIGRDTVRVLGG